MQVKDLMPPDPTCCTPDSTLQRVAELMVEHDCGEIPVVDNVASMLPVGVITDRDITCRTVAKGLNPLTLTVAMISTGGTMAKSIEALLKADARPEIIIAATHGLLLEGARKHLSHESVRAVFVTDTVPVRHANWPQLKVVSVAPLIAAAIRQFMSDGSLSDLC